MNKNPQKRTSVGFGGPMGGRRMPQKAKNFKKSIKDLFRYMSVYKISILIAVVFTITSTLLAIFAPLQIRELTNTIYPGREIVQMPGFKIDLEKIFMISYLLLAIYLLSFILGYFQSFIMSGVNQRTQKRFRFDISKKINKIPLNYFDTHNTGDTLSRVTNDVDTIGQTLNQSFSMLIASVVMLLGVLITMFVVCWQLALTVILTVPLSLIIMTVIMKLSQKYFVNQQKQLGALNGQIEESYSGLYIVKAFNGEEKSQKSFEKINGELFKSSRKASFFSGLMMPIMNFIANIGFVAVCTVGGILFIKGNIQIGTITMFFIYARMFQNPLTQIAQALGNLQHTAAAAERVFEFLNVEEQSDESYKTKKLNEVKGKVEFRNVKFGYNPDKIVIKDFSAVINPGSKIAIVGPTGAGKTTIINLLMRFYEINEGEILIDDIPISEFRREDVRKFFGMVLQDTWLFEGTIKENIIYAKENVTDQEVIKACEAANIDHFIRTLPKGYDLVLSDDVVISVGQKQLLTIARAMVQNSPMLILDEATSNVDTRTEQLIQDAMDKIAKGKTSFVIAHRLSTIKNADMILVLDNGDIIESGNHEELLQKKGFYSRLYNSQFLLNGE